MLWLLGLKIGKFNMNDTQVKETFMFFTPLYVGKFNDINNLNLKKEILKFKENSPGRKLTNVGGWQSNNIYYDFVVENDLYEFRTLLDKAQTVITEISSLWKLNFSAKLDNSWININSKNTFNTAHYHPASTFSFVYYVNANSNSGRIVFNRTDLMEHYVGGKKAFENSSEYTWEQYHFHPEENTFLIFPSWVQHYVEPNLSDEDRISIAINFCTE